MPFAKCSAWRAAASTSARSVIKRTKRARQRCVRGRRPVRLTVLPALVRRTDHSPVPHGRRVGGVGLCGAADGACACAPLRCVSHALPQFYSPNEYFCVKWTKAANETAD